MTILIAFHANQYRNFKSYYLEQVTQQSGQAFPKLPSYQRFIEKPSLQMDWVLPQSA